MTTCCYPSSLCIKYDLNALTCSDSFCVLYLFRTASASLIHRSFLAFLIFFMACILLLKYFLSAWARNLIGSSLFCRNKESIDLSYSSYFILLDLLSSFEWSSSLRLYHISRTAFCTALIVCTNVVIPCFLDFNVLLNLFCSTIHSSVQSPLTNAFCPIPYCNLITLTTLSDQL